MDYELNTEETHNPTEHFWKRLKVGDTVLGRMVVREAKDTTCGWPVLDDLMSDEGTSWMVCRAGFYNPACGCSNEEEEECAICAEDYHDSDQYICDDCHNELEALKADQLASRYD